MTPTVNQQGSIVSSNAIALIVALTATGLSSCQGKATSAVPAESSAAPSNPAPIAKLPPRSLLLPDEAGTVVDRLAKDFPANVDALFARGQIVDLFGQSDEAAWCWEECLALEPRFAQAHERLGMLATDRGDFESAVNSLAKACEIQPDLKGAKLHFGKTLLRLGRHKDAIPVLEQQSTQEPSEQEAWFLLGQAHFADENYMRAKDCYESALRLNDNSHLAWLGLSKAWNRLGAAEKADACRARFLELERQHDQRERSERDQDFDKRADQARLADACVIAADVYAMHGATKDAQDYWRRAAALDPANVECRRALARALARENRAADAIVVLEELRRLQPKNLEYLFGLAMLHDQQKDPIAATRCFQAVLELAPENDEAAIGLARIYLKQGQNLREAVRLSERAVQLRAIPENYFVLSTACVANGDLQGGRAALQQAMRLDPLNPRYAAAANVLGKD